MVDLILLRHAQGLTSNQPVRSFLDNIQ